MGGSAAIIITLAFPERRVLLIIATYINYSLKREGKHLPSPNHEPHSQINIPSSRQRRNWVERGKTADKINEHGKDNIDNRKFVTDHRLNKTQSYESKNMRAVGSIST